MVLPDGVASSGMVVNVVHPSPGRLAMGTDEQMPDDLGDRA
jgi:hypothetical protein